MSSKHAERTLLVGIRFPHDSAHAMRASLDELARLVDSAGGCVTLTATQELKHPSPATLIHHGKVERLRELVLEHQIQSVILDAELTPAQNRNLTEALQVTVLDRTAVILDIFARRAQSRAGRLQVELAQLQYRLPRLAGHYEFMQQAGHIGGRGPGERKLEIDRRRIRERIQHLRIELKDVRRHRTLHRRKREHEHLPLVSLVGYTNAGKSTLMNALTNAGVLVEDQLFATLDPTVRRLRLPSGRMVLLADTVGFIRKLPHHLVDAFQSTFEEVAASDLLCHIIDGASDEARAQRQTVDDVLSRLDLGHIPRLVVLNKCDLWHLDLMPATRATDPVIPVSAHTGQGLMEFLIALEAALDAQLQPMHLAIPQSEAALMHTLYEHAHVRRVVHGPTEIHVDALIPRTLLQRYQDYLALPLESEVMTAGVR